MGLFIKAIEASVENGWYDVCRSKISIFYEFCQALPLGWDADTLLYLFFHSLIRLFLRGYGQYLILYIIPILFFHLVTFLPFDETPRNYIFCILFERDKIANLSQWRSFRNQTQFPSFFATILMWIPRRVLTVRILRDPYTLRVGIEMSFLDGLVALRRVGCRNGYGLCGRDKIDLFPEA